MSIGFLLLGDPVWLIAAANLTYLIGIALPNVARSGPANLLLKKFYPSTTPLEPHAG